ncbi:Lrp/AsnC family transcriptional regulator [Thioclava sp. GXIMD2076]|uniref:Lrp/AsnC family transcriptional regulator n=1 Tax=unclassified Thioclava TaxID=2621713 RepID=UPI0030D4A095
MNRKPADLDQASLRILDALQQDSELSNAELAERAHLSASPCWRRVAEMREKGVIRGSVALVDPVSLGLMVNVFVHVTLEKQEKKTLKTFTDAIRDRPEIMECYLMTGSEDFMLRVVVEDLFRYQDLVMNFLTQIPGVANIRSSFALDQVKYTTALPTSHLRD